MTKKLCLKVTIEVKNILSESWSEKTTFFGAKKDVRIDLISLKIFGVLLAFFVQVENVGIEKHLSEIVAAKN